MRIPTEINPYDTLESDIYAQSVLRETDDGLYLSPTFVLGYLLLSAYIQEFRGTSDDAQLLKLTDEAVTYKTFVSQMQEVSFNHNIHFDFSLSENVTEVKETPLLRQMLELYPQEYAQRKLILLTRSSQTYAMNPVPKAYKYLSRIFGTDYHTRENQLVNTNISNASFTSTFVYEPSAFRRSYAVTSPAEFPSFNTSDSYLTSNIGTMANTFSAFDVALVCISGLHAHPQESVQTFLRKSSELQQEFVIQINDDKPTPFLREYLIKRMTRQERYDLKKT